MFEDEDELADDIGREERKEGDKEALAPLQVSLFYLLQHCLLTYSQSHPYINLVHNVSNFNKFFYYPSYLFIIYVNLTC